MSSNSTYSFVTILSYLPDPSLIYDRSPDTVPTSPSIWEYSVGTFLTLFVKSLTLYVKSALTLNLPSRKVAFARNVVLSWSVS